MKLTANARIKVLAKIETKSADGKNTYYKLTVMQGVEAGQHKCTENVFNFVKEGVDYDVEVLIDDAYENYYKFTDVKSVVNGATRETVSSNNVNVNK